MESSGFCSFRISPFVICCPEMSSCTVMVMKFLVEGRFSVAGLAASVTLKRIPMQTNTLFIGRLWRNILHPHLGLVKVTAAPRIPLTPAHRQSHNSSTHQLQPACNFAVHRGSSMSEPINKRIGDYEILNELGAGGMGKVYKVRNVISDRIEAMKILLPDLAGRQELAARFQREIKVLAALDHPNIAALRTALTLDNQLVMIMEYVEGTTLTQRMQQGQIPVADAVNYISQVLDALGYAHQHHVIHRDIKPANMMLTPQGIVKLMDFGIARSGDESTLTMTGTTLGSLGYMSPEQVKGEPTDARSDLYSVGISLYEMATGRRPFRETSDYSIMAAQVNQPPQPPIEIKPGLPPALNEIILLAIAKSAGARFQSAEAFRNALSRVVPVSPEQTIAAAHADTDRTVTSINPL